jgi:hypothetical protein
MSNGLDVHFEVDLGELIEGSHVLLLGIRTMAPGTVGSVVRVKFDPPVVQSPTLSTGWGIESATDDRQTRYAPGTGGAEVDAIGRITFGDEDLGVAIPPEAQWIEMTFYPANGFEPAAWTRRVRVELPTGRILELSPWDGDLSFWTRPQST